MKPAPLILSLLALSVLSQSAMAGTLYRWTDAQGRVHFTDQPPPAGAKSATEKNYRSGPAQPAANQPAISVVLYSTLTCGVHCERAKAHLDRRGIKYTSKDPSTSVDANEALRAGGGQPRVPTLMLGSEKLEGYAENTWDAALDKAGFPAAPEKRP